MCRLVFWSDQDFLNHRGFSGEPTRDEGLDGIAVGVANRPVTPPQWRLNWNPDKTWSELKIYPGSHRKIESVHTELELDPWRTDTIIYRHAPHFIRHTFYFFGDKSSGVGLLYIFMVALLCYLWVNKFHLFKLYLFFPFPVLSIQT